MKITDLYQRDTNIFISIIPGQELGECIEAVIKHCVDNKTSATLEFNGVSNVIESYIDPKEMKRTWYQQPGSSWYQAQKIKNREIKIENLGI